MTGALVIGVMGHVDHGKTTLVRALTGIETDRLAEEKRRGISMVLGFAHLVRPDRSVIDLIDMPGHERFVRMMISGATGIDAALLVVAADDGVRPQTVEHAEIAGLLGVRRAVVAVTRADLVDAARAASVGVDASALLRANGIEPLGAVAVSAPSGAGVDRLRAALCAATAGEAEDDGFALMAVDRAFNVAGAGTVVTGTLRRGGVAEGDELEAIAPGLAARTVRVRTLQVRGERVGRALAGGRTAVNLRGVEAGTVPRGTVLATPGVLRPGRFLAARLTTTASAPVIANGARLLLLLGTDEVEVRVRLLEGDVLEAGLSGYAQLHAARAVATAARERFVLRMASPALTVAGGVVLDVENRRQRRREEAVLTALRSRDGAAPVAIVADVLERAGPEGTTLAALGRAAGVAPARAARLLEGSGALVTRRGEVVGREGFERLLRLLPALVKAGERPAAPQGIVEEAVRRLLDSAVLARDGNRLLVRDAVREARAARDEAERAASLLARLERDGLTPPDLPTLAPDAATRRIVDRLVREGAVVRVTDRVQKRDWVFHALAVREARRRLGPALAGAPQGLLVGEAGTLLGLTRKHSVPLLEHLDAVRFTRRVGDRRVLAQAPGE